MSEFPEPTFNQTRIDGIYAGRLLMKSECLRILRTLNQTKAVSKAIELIQEIEVDPSANDTSR